MFVVPRRTLQTMLHALTPLGVDKIDGVAKRLNAQTPDRQAAMWEVLLLWALARQGQVVHEVAQSNGREPDVHFKADSIEFVADITTLSDTGLEKDAGREALWDDLQRLVRKAGLVGNHFSLHIRSEPIAEFGDTKVKMALPVPAARASVVKTHIEPFVRGVKASGRAAKLAVKEEGLDFTVGYDPDQMYALQSYPSYTAPMSLERNPLFNRMKAKSSQLRGVPENTPRGLIICDGGADLMSRQVSVGRQSLSRSQIAQAFLDDRDSFDFALLVSVATHRGVLDHKTTYKLQAELVVSAAARISGRLAGDALGRLTRVLNAALAALPPMINDPKNVSYRVLEAKAPDMIGGLHWSNKMVKISSRVVMEVLAGRLSIADFQTAYGWTPDGQQVGGDPFAAALDRGKMIKSVAVEPDASSDDDWLAFEFGQPDPAIAPFTGARSATAAE